jgi:hypothetical protein
MEKPLPHVICHCRLAPRPGEHHKAKRVGVELCHLVAYFQVNVRRDGCHFLGLQSLAPSLQPADQLVGPCHLILVGGQLEVPA